jgi:predicted ester cyclase
VRYCPRQPGIGEVSRGGVPFGGEERVLVNAKETHEFAERLMREVWEPFDHSAVGRFYNRDVRGHNRSQELIYDDVVNRLRSDTGRFADPVYDIRDIVASEEKFAIRFIYTATVVATGEPVETEVNYFYHLKDGKVSEFWVLADIDFDYKAKG